ncbi:hypothetical protein [Methylovulum psychrotolerans]|uniref:Uncharacterized protein n=1 Tax=Methylovulum psychrotolerans TaxID=1704499 RepID=A0A1Z4C0F8_9GAMM|nr:hypothetical protein [Methylovulum psychrotolerans]ASF47000.1 hypothetical protein CEK71_13475 [Methylovulum psychrotolerans]
MPKYAQLTDLPDDAALTVDEAHLSRADIYIDGELVKRSISPADITLPQPLLTELAVLMASRMAAIEQSVGSDTTSPLIAKAREYQRTIDGLLSSLTREAVGLAYPTTESQVFFEIGRA